MTASAPNLLDVFQNHVLVNAIIGWLLAQILKVPFEYMMHKRWDWALFFSAGGMPSSHSTLVVAAAMGTGLHAGFNSPDFAIATCIAMIVVYDATGVRRQAGIHAQKINVLVNELLSGHPISEKDLLEVIGHTPREAVGGVIWGITSALVLWKLLG